MAVPKDPRDLETAEPFVSLFPINPDDLAVITRSMRDRGYINDKPILAWRDAFGTKGRTVVVDGHSRRLAALDAGLDEVRVTLRRFDAVDDALAATIEEQAQRRNINRSQLVVFVLSALASLDNGTRGQGSRNDLVGRSAKQLAEMLGVGTATIERARALIDFNDPVLLGRVKGGEVGLKAAVEEGKRHDRAEAKATTPSPAPAEPEPEDEPDIDPHARDRDVSRLLRIRRELERQRVQGTGIDQGLVRAFNDLSGELRDRLGQAGLDRAIAERAAPEPEPEPEPELEEEPEEETWTAHAAAKQREYEEDLRKFEQEEAERKAAIRPELIELFDTYGHELTLEIGLRVLRLAHEQYGRDYVGYHAMREELTELGEQYVPAEAD